MTFNEWIDERSELINRFGMIGFIDMLLVLQEAYEAGAQAEREALQNALLKAHEETNGMHNYYQVAANKLSHARAIEAKLKEKNHVS
jgi:hypothetical protein